jgi:hypothetical protein
VNVIVLLTHVGINIDVVLGAGLSVRQIYFLSCFLKQENR